MVWRATQPHRDFYRTFDLPCCSPESVFIEDIVPGRCLRLRVPPGERRRLHPPPDAPSAHPAAAGHPLHPPVRPGPPDHRDPHLHPGSFWLQRAAVPARDAGRVHAAQVRKISAVFQEDRLCENLSAASNIRLVCTETIDYILKKTEGKTLIFVTHEEQEAVWLKADKTLKFMKDHLIK